jgi:hypothetical protein
MEEEGSSSGKSVIPKGERENGKKKYPQPNESIKACFHLLPSSRLYFQANLFSEKVQVSFLQNMNI